MTTPKTGRHHIKKRNPRLLVVRGDLSIRRTSNVLIYHTHATEANLKARTDDKNRNRAGRTGAAETMH